MRSFITGVLSGTIVSEGLGMVHRVCHDHESLGKRRGERSSLGMYSGNNNLSFGNSRPRYRFDRGLSWQSSLFMALVFIEPDVLD